MVGGGTATITGLTRRQKKAEGEMIWKIRNDPGPHLPLLLTAPRFSFFSSARHCAEATRRNQFVRSKARQGTYQGAMRQTVSRPNAGVFSSHRITTLLISFFWRHVRRRTGWLLPYRPLIPI